MLVRRMKALVPLFALALVARPTLASCAAVPPRAASEASSRGAQDAQAASLELRLEDAWTMALANNITLARSALTEEIARYDAKGSWGAFDPVFDLSASYADGEQPQNNPFVTGADVLQFDRREARAGLTVPVTTGGRFELSTSVQNTRSNSTTTGEEFSDTNASVSYVQPLLRGAWRREATVEQERARLALVQRRAELAAARERLLLDVHVAYFDLVAAREEREVRRRALDLGAEQLRQNRERLRVGVGTEVDVLQAETNVATREQELLLAETNVDASADALKALVFGRPTESEDGHRREDWNREIVPLTGLPQDLDAPDPRTWLTRLDGAFERRPDLAARRLDIDSAQVDLVQRRSEREAALDLTLTVSSGASETGIGGSLQTALGYDFPTYSAAISYSVPLRNRRAGNAERAARANLRNAHLSYAELENEVVADLRDALRDVHYQARAVEAATKSRQFAERQLEAEQVRYREGLSTTFQVLEFQQTLSAALSSEQAARANLAKARATLLHAEGRLGESLGLGEADLR
jgi:outer membrane protein TolC